MVGQLSTDVETGFYCGTVVEPSAQVARVQGPEGVLVPRDMLGPGIVQELADDGRVRVRWVGAASEAWMEPDELRSLGPNAHLVTIYRCDEHGHLTLQQRRVVTAAGLKYNWTVELLPQDIVRTVRSDGLAWTFEWNPIWSRMETIHTRDFGPLEDDDAEALVVAELGV